MRNAKECGIMAKIKGDPSMTRYPYLLFDADNTLFDFDEANVSSFRAVCA